MEEIKIYRRRGFTFMLMALFGAVTIVMIIGLVQSYFPKYSGLEHLKITGTGRTISVIFTLLMGAITLVYVKSFIRRGRVPVIRIGADCVHFDLSPGESETLYYHDVERIEPIEANFENAMVSYRYPVPEGDARYPAAVAIPLGLTMTRAHALKIINERCAAGANLPAPPITTPKEGAATPLGADATDHECEVPRGLPPVDRTVRIYWERWAPVVVELGIMVIVAVLLLIRRDPKMVNDYLWFVNMRTWCNVIIGILLVAGIVILGYIIYAVSSPKLTITRHTLKYRGVEVPLSSIRNVTVEATRKRVAPGRYVTEHFIRFNYRPEAEENHTKLPGLDPDLLEMRPRRIAAIINSRISCE